MMYLIPNPDLLLCGDTLYGTDSGTVFSIMTNGMNYTIIWSFTNFADGLSPAAGLLMSGNTLYGTTTAGGSFGHGTIFKVNTDGSDYAVLRNFSWADGAYPVSSLILV